ncbi:MAG: hypothetical protein JSW49_10130, partial [candidate division WOR-3 bacterium]
MKRCLLIGLFSIMPLFAATITRTMTLSMQDLHMYKANDQDVVELIGHGVLVRPGAPRMPMILHKLVIPAGAALKGVSITSEEWEEIPGIFNIVPAQPDVPLPMPGKIFEPQLFPPDPEIYASNTPYPDSTVKNGGTGNMNGYRIAHVEIFPLRYIPSQGRLLLATSITYEIEYEENRVANIIATDRQRDVFGDALRRIVTNPEDVTRFAPNVRKNTFSRSLPPGDFEYVVISEPPMDTVFERFAAWKTK